jgi:hypothetical protein
VSVPRAFLREGWHLLGHAIHLLWSRALIFLCLLLALSTGFPAARHVWFALSGEPADGRVISEIEELGADWDRPAAGRTTAGIVTAPARRFYRAVVEFQADGRAYAVASTVRSPAHLYAIGSKVEVVYPPGAPRRAMLRPELPDFWLQAGILLMATVLAAGTVYAWWHGWRWRLASRRRERVVIPGP